MKKRGAQEKLVMTCDQNERGEDSMVLARRKEEEEDVCADREEGRRWFSNRKVKRR